MALVDSKHPGILHLNGSYQEKHEVTLMPGINKVPDEAWNEIKAAAEKGHRVLKHYLSEEIVTELKGKKESEFGKLPETEAVKMVKATNVEGLLKEFLSSEKKATSRASVLDAIEAQLKAIDPASKPKE